MKKSEGKIKELLEFWLLKYYTIKDKSELNGKETFTIFDLLNSKLQVNLIQRLNLREGELPALSLKINNDSYLVNTTRRFVFISGYQKEVIEYTNFESHIGFGDFVIKKRLIGKPINVKTDGYYSDFKIKTKTGKEIIWKIPTGTPGFGFWSVTKKCELIGRKYLVD